MYSDGEFGQLSPVGESIPIPNRMLRRLKKAKTISDICPESETLGSEKSGGEDALMVDPGSGREDELRSDFEDLVMEEVGIGAKKALDFDTIAEEFGERDEDGAGDLGTGEEIRDLDFDTMAEELGERDEDGAGDLGTGEELRDLDFDTMGEELGERDEDGAGDLGTGEELRDLDMKEASRKRTISEEADGDEDENTKNKDKKKKKKKKKKSIGFDELPVSSASMNMSKKERREYLDQLRAENQRLLRETRDAAFKPLPLVRKPISSVLEKIRQRKHEISTKFLSRRESYSVKTSDGLSREVTVDAAYEEVVAEENGDGKTSKMTSTRRTPERENRLENSNADSSGNSDNPSHSEAENNSSHEDPSGRSQMTDSRHELQETTPNSPLEEIMAPSVLSMNLKLNLSPLHDDSSEEENDKENLEPEACASSPNGDPVRAFIDEEAEEEDDSDNDLLRFKDDEEDEDEADDDLKDMIVSQFKEDPTDKERRNELHQKWLEQQDAAGTEKLLQKLKRGLPQTETHMLEEEDDADDEEEQAKSDDVEGEEDSCQVYSTRMIIKKIKEMIPLEFTDKNDEYVKSDDEEMEKKELKQRFCNKAELKAKMSSPARDESSKELFYRIKKVNNVPQNRKKAKPTSLSDKLLMGINRNAASSKSSFLGRGPKNSLTTGSHKRGSSIVRGFIFERDDSNSRSSNSVPEEAPETIQERSRPTRAQAKFNSSQSQIRSKASQSRAAEGETSSSSGSRTPLYEILKRSSTKSCFTSRQSVISSSHTESIFAAFKVDKKQAKTNAVNTLF